MHFLLYQSYHDQFTDQSHWSKVQCWKLLCFQYQSHDALSILCYIKNRGIRTMHVVAILCGKKKKGKRSKE